MSYGPGDPQTWPATTNHPLDPRNADEDCPVCDEPMDEHSCGWEPLEPDYEEMLR